MNKYLMLCKVLTWFITSEVCLKVLLWWLPDGTESCHKLLGYIHHLLAGVQETCLRALCSCHPKPTLQLHFQLIKGLTKRMKTQFMLSTLSRVFETSNADILELCKSSNWSQLNRVLFLPLVKKMYLLDWNTMKHGTVGNLQVSLKTPL